MKGTSRARGEGEENKPRESDEKLKGGVAEGMWWEGGGEVVIGFEAECKEHC